MRNMKRYSTLFLSLVFCASPTVFGADNTDNPMVRKEFTNENAPIEFHFRMLLTRIPMEHPQYDIAAHTLQKIGIREPDIADVTDYLLTIISEIETEISQTMHRIACVPNESTPPREVLFPIYNEIDELRQTIYAKYLAIATAEMSRRGYDHFRDMIMLTGIGFSVIYLEARNSQMTTDEIDTEHKAMCKDLEKKLQ